MVNNQIEFNNTYFNNKEIIKEIKIETEDFEEERLVIEGYPNLEKLYLYDIQEINKITLKDLPQLQECTIWDCNLKELTIENCPQIKKLNVRQNNLTSLEFIKNLEELEIDGNIELIKMLEPYKKIIQKSNKSVQDLEKEKKTLSAQLATSQQKYENLKKFLKEILVLLSKDNQEELINELNSEIETREKSPFSVYSTEIKTVELTSGLRMSIEEIKEVKKELETNLTESEKKIQELEKQLAEAKERSEEREKKIEELSKFVSTANQEQIPEVKMPVYEKTIDFLKAKSNFLNARRETIKELQECFNKWDKLGRRNAVISEVGSIVSNVGGVITDVIIFGIPKAVGEAIKAGSNFTKIVVDEKGSKEFQISLRDEDELIHLDNSYDSLIKIIQDNEEVNNFLGLKTRRLRDGRAKLFNNDKEGNDGKHEIFDILINDGVWKERYLNLEKMEAAINSLNKNLKDELEREWEEQFDKLKLKISKKYGNLILQEQNIQTKIQQLKGRLDKSISSAKNKLKSRKLLTEEKNKSNERRELLLNNLLNIQAEIIRLGDTIDRQEKLTSLKKELLEIALRRDHKEFAKELDNLCQIQIELTKLQVQLKELQSKQQQAQILSPVKTSFDLK